MLDVGALLELHGKKRAHVSQKKMEMEMVGKAICQTMMNRLGEVGPFS